MRSRPRSRRDSIHSSCCSANTAPNETDQRITVGEDPHDVGPTPDLTVQSLLGIIGPDLAPQALGEGKDVVTGGLEVLGDLGQLVFEGIQDPLEL